MQKVYFPARHPEKYLSLEVLIEISLQNYLGTNVIESEKRISLDK